MTTAAAKKAWRTRRKPLSPAQRGLMTVMQSMCLRARYGEFRTFLQLVHHPKYKVKWVTFESLRRRKWIQGIKRTTRRYGTRWVDGKPRPMMETEVLWALSDKGRRKLREARV